MQSSFGSDTIVIFSVGNNNNNNNNKTYFYPAISSKFGGIGSTGHVVTV